MAVLDRENPSSYKPTFNVFITDIGRDLSRSGYIEYIKYITNLADNEVCEIYDDVVIDRKRKLICKLSNVEAAHNMTKKFGCKSIQCEIT